MPQGMEVEHPARRIDRHDSRRLQISLQHFGTVPPPQTLQPRGLSRK
jgi:hypothetical protein